MWISAKNNFVQIEVAVVPNSGRNQVVGEHNGRLKVKVQSPPVEGAANQSLIDYLSKILKTPKKNIQITRGETSRQKTVAVVGLELGQVHERLQLAVGVTLK
jgi:uncharacterized protein (TIGR00251 family)